MISLVRSSFLYNHLKSSRSLTDYTPLIRPSVISTYSVVTPMKPRCYSDDTPVNPYRTLIPSRWNTAGFPVLE